jgi:hypothetical protein
MAYEIPPDLDGVYESRIERLHDALANEYGADNVEVWYSESDDTHGCIVATIDDGVGTPTHYKLGTEMTGEFKLEVTNLDNPCEVFDWQAGRISLAPDSDGPTMERKNF